MKKHKNNDQEGKSLKTFFIYTIIVFLIIFISLSVRLIFIYGQSKFDGNNIDIAIFRNGQIDSILGISPKNKSISILKITKGNISLSSLYYEYGLKPEAKIDVKDDVSAHSADKIITMSLLKSGGAKTDLTIIDKVRLMIFLKTVSNLEIRKGILSPSDDITDNNGVITELFKDENIISENKSIQIINATNVSGLGQGLERVIVNKGGNVISVTSSREKKQNSIIQFYNERSYTVKKLEKILKIQSEMVENKSIGEIAIIIGDDYIKSLELK